MSRDRTRICAKLNSKAKSNTAIPRMMTIRQVASTGILPEHAIRTMVKNNAIPYVSSGNTVYINFGLLCDKLNNLSS